MVLSMLPVLQATVDPCPTARQLSGAMAAIHAGAYLPTMKIRVTPQEQGPPCDKRLSLQSHAHAVHVTDAGVVGSTVLHAAGDTPRLEMPPGTSHHRAAQNYGDAGLASAGTPTPQIHRDVPQQSRAVHRLQKKDLLSSHHSELRGLRGEQVFWAGLEVLKGCVLR